MKRAFSAVLVTAAVCGGVSAGDPAAAVEGQARPSLIQRDSSTHCLKQLGNEDLVIIVNYLEDPRER